MPRLNGREPATADRRRRLLRRERALLRAWKRQGYDLDTDGIPLGPEGEPEPEAP